MTLVMTIVNGLKSEIKKTVYNPAQNSVQTEAPVDCVDCMEKWFCEAQSEGFGGGSFGGDGSGSGISGGSGFRGSNFGDDNYRPSTPLYRPSTPPIRIFEPLIMEK